MVFNALQMPLVNENNNLLALGLIDSLEEVLIALVNEDLLDLGEEDACRGGVPVDQVLIKTHQGLGYALNP